MSNFNKVFKLKIVLLIIIAVISFCNGLSYGEILCEKQILRVPIAEDTYARIVKTIEKQQEELLSRNTEPLFTVWVICRQNKERSPIIASIIMEEIMTNKSLKNLRQHYYKGHFDIESYGLERGERDDEDLAVTRDPLLRKHMLVQIPESTDDSADLILVMTRSQKAVLVSKGFPEKKIKLVLDNEDIDSPIGDANRYNVFREKIRRNIDAIMLPILSAYSKKIGSMLDLNGISNRNDI